MHEGSSNFAELLKGAKRGDEASFASLWRPNNPRVVRFASGMVGRNDAADVASAVWVDVVRKLGSFEGSEAGFRAWLFTIVRSRTIDLRRVQGRRREELGEEMDERPRAGRPDDPESVLVER